MKNTLVFLSFFLFSQMTFALGAPYLRSGTTAITDVTGTVNQVTVPTDSEGKQDKQWEQEEESLDTTIYDKDKRQKEEEQKKEEQTRLKDSAIDEHRFDVPSRKTYQE